tara:strand:- start:115 stop:237 length:123 start_codon:yes stop_codon:yes gene_type:complete
MEERGAAGPLDLESGLEGVDWGEDHAEGCGAERCEDGFDG